MPQTQSKQAPVPDFIPAESSPDFIPDDSGDVVHPPQQSGLVDALRANWRSNVDPQDTGHPISDFLHNAGGTAAKTITAPFLHPLETGKSLLRSELGSEPMAEQGAALTQSKHPLADLTGGLAGGAVLSGLMGAAGEGASAVKGAFTPYESPVLPPGTRAYQTLASKIGPESVPTGQKVLPGITENLQAEHPSILKFAQQSKIPLKTPEEYSVAAKGLRGQVTSKFYDELQKPFENDRLQVSPEVANYKVPGRIQPLGSHPTVGELNEALNAANEESGPIHQEGANAFDRTRVMAAENTARQIRQLLNEHLGEKSGQTPEQVGALRERGGALKNVEENAQARSVANRMAQSMSPFQATSLKSFLLRSGQSLLGGPEAIANRGFRSALGKVPAGTPTELPNFQLQPPGGATPPPTFSPASRVAGPEPLAPPPIRQGPQAPSFSPPPVRGGALPQRFAAPPIRYPEQAPEVPAPPVRMPPGRQKFSPPAVREGRTFNPRTGKYE